jgi:hypothetical protein
VSALAVELIHKTIWYPTILGILVVVFAIGLFCGSIYLLLGTNLGARLGFLVAFTALMGFLVILSTLWMSTASPLNTLKGRIPSWKVQEIVTNPAQAKTVEVRTITKTGRKVTAIEAANVKAAVDTALVTQPEIKAQGKLPPNTNKYARFDLVTRYKILKTYELGGGKPNPLSFEFTHKPLFAVAQFCEVEPPDPIKYPFGVAPPKNPACLAGSTKSGWLIIERDLGSVRMPPVVAFISFTLLFALGLLMLHWRERDEQEAASKPKGSLVPAPAQA